MTILVGSRYMGQDVVPVTNSDGSTSSAVYGPQPVAPGTFVYYTVRTGDRWDIIASMLYGVPDYWWKIARINPEVFYPENLIPGSIIRIPTV
jgi:nucleoid-associated protein YgaU